MTTKELFKRDVNIYKIAEKNGINENVKAYLYLKKIFDQIKGNNVKTSCRYCDDEELIMTEYNELNTIILDIHFCEKFQSKLSIEKIHEAVNLIKIYLDLYYFKSIKLYTTN